HHHDHGDGHGHSHLPPDALGWRSLFALGVSGGLLPCPSALVVMLAAISLGRIGFGLVLIVAFSAGLAGVLGAIGLVFVYARSWFARLPVDGRFARYLPVASALVISVAGLLIVANALSRTGLLGGLPNVAGIMRWITGILTPVHVHARRHGDDVHNHAHGETSLAHRHAAENTPLARLDRRLGDLGLYQLLRPLVVGVVHGLAGSAAVAL